MRTANLIAVCLLLSLAGCSRTKLAKSGPPAAPPAAPATDGAEWYLKRRLPEGVTEYPADRYLAAQQQAARMPRYSWQDKLGAAKQAELAKVPGVTSHNWIPLGPGNVGGRTRSLVINPQNPNILYAGAVTGGVFKSIDGGATWNVLTDGLPVLNIGALALDPTNPRVIFAGSGESWDGRPGLGIFKSSDSGATWTLLGAPTASNAFQYINRIAISKNNPTHIYAATRNGLYASKDGGATWASSGINANYYGCTDMVIRNDQPTDYLFATCSGSSSAQTTAVYRNTDAGGAGAWSSVFTTANMGTSVIAVAPSQPSTIYLGAAVGTRDAASLVGVYRSTSNGDAGSWVQQASGSDTSPWVQLLFSYAGNAAAWCTGAGSSAGYTGATGGSWSRVMAVDPLDPNRVWLGGADLSRSDDGGVTWGVAARWDINNAAFSHADRHLLVFHPNYDGVNNQTLFQTTDSGIFRSDNARAAVSTGTRAGCTTEYSAGNKLVWKRIDSSYTSMQFYHGVAYPGGVAYFGGAQDNGTHRGTDSGGLNAWSNLFGGDGGSVALDPADSNRLMLSAQTLDLWRVTNGVNISPAQSGITEAASSFPFIAYLAADPNNGLQVYLGGTTTLWRSSNQGTSWTAAAPVEKSSAVSAITVSPFDSNVVFFGTAQGFIYSNNAALSSNGTTAWTSTRPRSGNVASIAFDPTDPNVMYATYSTFKSAAGQAHVYRSSDAGRSWTPSDGSGSSAVPDIGIWRILVDPQTPSTLYLGSDLGLLVSADSGATWTYDSGLPSVYIEDLNTDQTNNWLFAFTFGRGVYKTPLSAATPLSCTYAVSPTSVTADVAGGSYPVTVSTSAGCAWTAIPGASPARFPIQSPAQGFGSGTAFVAVPPSLFTAAASDTVTIAGRSVQITQPGATLLNVGNDAVASASALTIPSAVRRTAAGTSAAGDPVHSCTKSADSNTLWWQVTPSVNGVLSVQARGDRTDVFGNYGMVLTAYASKAPAVELGCEVVARDALANTLFGFKFVVTAGATYLIEAASTTASTSGNYNLIVSMGTTDPAVTVTPAAATVQPGKAQPFSAQVANSGNNGVRWTLVAPAGVVSVTGAYTAPQSVAGPTLVGLTATAFADTTKSASAMITVVPAATVSPSLLLPVAGIVNAASFKSAGTVAPGEMVTIFGSGFGPSPLAGLTVGPTGLVSTISGNTLVLFDGTAAPMVYSVTGQVSAVVPYTVAGKSSTQMQIYYNGQLSSAVTVPVAQSAPGLFTLNAQGFGPLAMFNQNGSVNGATNPAVAGEVVVFYGTGEGQTNPSGVDGLLAIAALPKPLLPVSVTIGGVPAVLDYFGAAPGFASGLFQVNAHVPAGVAAGAAVPVVVTVGTSPSSAAATMAVK